MQFKIWFHYKKKNVFPFVFWLPFPFLRLYCPNACPPQLFTDEASPWSSATLSSSLPLVFHDESDISIDQLSADYVKKFEFSGIPRESNHKLIDLMS